MKKDPDEVRKWLRLRVLHGYNPVQSHESCEDYWTDWFVLDKKEFERIKREALREKERMDSAERESAAAGRVTAGVAKSEALSRTTISFPLYVEPGVARLLHAALAALGPAKRARIAEGLKGEGMNVEIADIERVLSELDARIH